MNINYSSISKNIILLIFVMSIAYIISTILYIYLPKVAPTYIIKSQDSLEYKRYDINNAFKEKLIVKKPVVKKIVKKQEYQFLSNIILSAIYDMGEKSGFIIVMEKGKPQTYILALKDNFKGYTLDKIFAKYVIFSKNNKDYRLSIVKEKDIVKYEKIAEEKVINQNIEVDNDKVTIKRTLVNDYIQNFDKIWNDIAINEVKTSKGIDGFKISRVKKRSVFAKLGLHRGDIIKSVNNIELKSYNDAFKLYKKIDKLKVINMVILRDNIQREIIYEIR